MSGKQAPVQSPEATTSRQDPKSRPWYSPWLIPDDAHCHHDRDLLVRTALTNILALYALGMTVYLTAVHIYSQVWMLAWTNGLSLLAFAACIVLNAARRFLPARLGFMSLALFEMALYARIYGSSVGLKSFYFVATMTPLLLFAPAERRSIGVSFLLVGAGFAYVRWLEVHQVAPLAQLDPGLLTVMGHSYNIAALLIGILQSWAMYKLVGRRELRLTEMALFKANSAKFTALGQMAGSIAHEIMTPLTVVGRNAEHLRAGLEAAGVTGEQGVMARHRLDRISHATNQMVSIARGLRLMSRDTSGFEAAPFAVSEAIADAESLARERFSNAGTTLTIQMPSAAIVAFGDRVQTAHAILNLINNSLDATEGRAGSQVTLSVDQGGPADPDFISIAVEDNGGGIPDGLQDRIMEPFFSTKGLEKGTGIGLSISRSMLRQHGGDLLLDCPRDPTRFVIRLRRK